jgi:hypothetical protein
MQVFCTSPWIPVEWIKAHGLEPCGVWSANKLLFDSLPASAGVCAFAEAVVGLTRGRADSAVIYASTCDQLRRGFDALDSVRSRALLFNIPATWQSPAAWQIYRSEIERLGRFLRDLGGKAPSAEALAGEMARCGAARTRLLEAAPQYSARRFAEAVAQFHGNGSVRLHPGNADRPADGVPLAIVGGPLTAPHWKLFDVIESAGGRVVLNGTETGERSLVPAIAPAERAAEPLESLARGYFENIIDVFQRPNTRLYAWLKRRLVARKVRGIVLWHFTGCDLWRAEAQTLRETFSLPVLLLEADEARGSSPRGAGRIQAFVETLK